MRQTQSFRLLRGTVRFGSGNNCLTLVRTEVRRLVFARLCSWRCNLLEMFSFKISVKLMGASTVHLELLRRRLAMFMRRRIVFGPPLTCLESRR
jgi:hypothetical protein